MIYYLLEKYTLEVTRYKECPLKLHIAPQQNGAVQLLEFLSKFAKDFFNNLP